MQYHLYEKRDGAIINQILKEDGEITTDANEVSDLLFQTLKEIQVDEQWGWLKEREFAKLSDLTQKEMMEVTTRISTYKS